MTDKETPYREVRSLERALSLMDVLGEYGWSGPTSLAQRTGIDRATVYRLLATLIRCGYVVRREQDGKYFLSSRIRTLSYGIREEDARVRLVSGPLARLVKQIQWPSDFAVLSAGRLMIVDSNNALSAMSLYRSVLGLSRPVMRSALGRAMLAAMAPDELAEALETIRLAGGQDAEDVQDTKMLAYLIDETRRQGFGSSRGEATPNVGAIALPVMARGRVAGAINVVIFKSQFNVEQASGRYLEPLRACVREVEQAFEAAGDLSSEEISRPRGLSLAL